MHIAFLTPEFPHPRLSSSGGIGTSILNLAKGLTQLGHKVTVLVYGQRADEEFDENGIRVMAIRNLKLKGFSRWLTQRKIRQIINGLVDTEQLDLVEAPDWTGITSNIRPKCPVVIRLHGSDTYFCHLDGRPVKPRNKRQERKALERADHIISVSAFTAEVTRSLFGLKSEIPVIPNSIDIVKFEPSGTSTNAGKVLYFGTLIRKKGLLELPYIFNALAAQNAQATLELVGKDSFYIITGSPSTWELMQPLFTETALHRVTYSGAVSYSEVRKKIDEAEVCVFPTFAEALPVSWIEAMAMEKSVVASSIGWAPEVITDGVDGILVHPASHTEFAGYIDDLLNDPEGRKIMGKMARKRILSNFASDVVALQNESFYRSIISRTNT